MNFYIFKIVIYIVMSKKKTKHIFSIEEKELIQKKKIELRLIKKSKGIRRSKFMNKINKGVGKVFQKVVSKKLGNFKDQLEQFEDIFNQDSQNEMGFMNKMFSEINFDNINDLGKGGTTFKKHPQKKKIVVDLDFLDDDE